MDNVEQLETLYTDLLTSLSSNQREHLHDKVFCAPEAVDGVAAARAAAFARDGIDPTLPTTCVTNSPCLGGLVAGVQLWSVDRAASDRVELSTATVGEECVGRILETDSARLLFLNGITGIEGPGGLSTDGGAQYSAILERINRTLEAHGFSFYDVARTWIHVDHLLDWYDGLNQVRNRFFQQLRKGHPDLLFTPPASTGIQGGHPKGAELQIDVLALSRPATKTDGASDPMFRAMRTTRQNEATEYGSAFSRGMRMGDEEELLLVSGTASIDTNGLTVHLSDYRAQIIETYRDTADVLANADASLNDVVTALLYFKDEAAYRAHCDLIAEERIPRLPGIPVYADVCRDDLLFEMEVTAMKTTIS